MPPCSFGLWRKALRSLGCLPFQMNDEIMESKHLKKERGRKTGMHWNRYKYLGRMVILIEFDLCSSPGSPMPHRHDHSPIYGNVGVNKPNTETNKQTNK